MSKKKDVMGDILTGSGHHSDHLSRELDCLIYRSEKPSSSDPLSPHPDEAWKVSKENVSVEVWESSAKIRMRISLGRHKHISMKRIASIAVDAILKELEKEGGK